MPLRDTERLTIRVLFGNDVFKGVHTWSRHNLAYESGRGLQQSQEQELGTDLLRRTVRRWRAPAPDERVVRSVCPHRGGGRVGRTQVLPAREWLLYLLEGFMQLCASGVGFAFVGLSFFVCGLQACEPSDRFECGVR